MRKEQDRKIILSQINAAAALYKSHLVGKRFLYVFERRYIEVIYKAENLRHLTGVDTNLSANTFYRYAVRNILSESQFWFSAAHPYALCVRKIAHIREIATLAGSESFMLEEITTNTQMYKFGTTELNFTLCMNKDIDDAGNEKGDCFVVQSLRDEDCFAKAKSAYEVTHIFSRPNDEKLYTDLLYMDKKVTLNDLPDDIKNMLAPSLTASTRE